MWLKRIFWYNMFHLQMSGKSLLLSQKSVPQILAATIILLTIDFFLWDLHFWTDKISYATLEPILFLGTNIIGKIFGLILLGICYLLLLIIVSKRTFFEQTLEEFVAMPITEKVEQAQKGKYIIVIPFAFAILMLCYILFVRID